jgi:hypothetical protein
MATEAGCSRIRIYVAAINLEDDDRDTERTIRSVADLSFGEFTGAL